MSSNSSNNNIQTSIESLNKEQYDNIYSNTKFFSEKDKYILRKQFLHIIPSYYNQNKNNFIPSILSSQTSKTQIEEYKKLQSEINSIKSKITELEISKRTKISKIESLRFLIRRIANEDCFLYNQQINNNNYISRERKSISNTKKNNNYYQQIKYPNNNNNININNNISITNDDNTIEISEENEGSGKVGQAKPNPDGEINWCFEKTENNNCYSFSFMDKCFSYCKKNLYSFDNFENLC